MIRQASGMCEHREDNWGNWCVGGYIQEKMWMDRIKGSSQHLSKVVFCGLWVNNSPHLHFLVANTYTECQYEYFCVVSLSVPYIVPASTFPTLYVTGCTSTRGDLRSTCVHLCTCGDLRSKPAFRRGREPSAETPWGRTQWSSSSLWTALLREPLHLKNWDTGILRAEDFEIARRLEKF